MFVTNVQMTAEIDLAETVQKIVQEYSAVAVCVGLYDKKDPYSSRHEVTDTPDIPLQGVEIDFHP